MPTFKDLDSLLRYVEKNLKFSLQEVGLMVENEVREYIKKALYDSYQPQDYIRTYDFLNSVKVQKVTQVGNGYMVEIGFDTDRIIPSAPDDSFWNQHMDIRENDVHEFIPLWMEYGTETANGSLWERKGIKSMETISEQLKASKKHLDIIKQSLAKKGINVKVI